MYFSKPGSTNGAVKTGAGWRYFECRACATKLFPAEMNNRILKAPPAAKKAIAHHDRAILCRGRKTHEKIVDVVYPKILRGPCPYCGKEVNLYRSTTETKGGLVVDYSAKHDCQERRDHARLQYEMLKSRSS